MVNELSRVRVRWDGWDGGPGISTFYLEGTDYVALAPLHDFFEAIKSSFPTGLTITVPSEGDIIDEATGTLTGQWQHGTDLVTTCTGPGSFNAASGALLRWHTSQIHNGRRLRGHTFLVPLTNENYDDLGHVDPVAVTYIQDHANQLLSAAANELAVWGRPKAGSGGLRGEITTASVSPKVAILKSRRD